MMKAVIYVRVSTILQDYDRQIEDLTKYAQRNDLEVIEVIEEKESGFNDTREGFNKLLQYTKDQVDVVLVWELTRLSRKSIKLQESAMALVEKGIHIFAYKENLSSHNPDGKVNSNFTLLLALFASMAENEANTLKARTTAGKFHSIVTKGNSYTYRKPFGYDIIDKKLVINEEEAAIVREVYDLVIAGETYSKIGLKMRAKKLKRVWSQSSIQVLIHNTVYKGTHEYISKNGSKADVTTPAIVSEEIWEKANQVVNEKVHHRSLATERKPVPYLLKGLIRCGRCGRRYTHSDDTYICCSKVNGGYHNCKSTNISRPSFDAVVWNLVSQICSSTISGEFLSKQKQPLEDEKAALLKNITDLEGALADLQAQAKKYFTLAYKFIETNESLLKDTMAKIDANGQKQKEVKAEIEATKVKVNLVQGKLDAIEQGFKYEIKEDSEKADIIHKLLEKLTVYGSRGRKIVQIEFKTGALYDLLYYEKRWYGYDNGDTFTYYDRDPSKKSLELHPKLNWQDVDIYVTYGEDKLFKSPNGIKDGEFYSIDDFYNLLKDNNMLTLLYDFREAQREKALEYIENHKEEA